MQLHKTQALFLRNVEANIKQSEVEEVCSLSNFYIFYL